MPLNQSSIAINKVTEDAEIREHQEGLEPETWMIPMNDLDPTKQAKGWILEE